MVESLRMGPRIVESVMDLWASFLPALPLTNPFTERSLVSGLRWRQGLPPGS